MISEETIENFLSRTTLRQIEVMVTLQRRGSISKAAEALGTSVANVSRMSKRFENNLGVSIFGGDKRRSVLLADSNKLIDTLIPLMAQIDQLKSELHQLQS